MKTPILFVCLAIGAGFIFSSNAIACPCHPCTCSPCTCGGGGGGKSGGGGKHHDEHGHHGDHHGGGGVGIGGTLDLSGIGHQNGEPNPFSVGGGESHHASTEEKPKSKTSKHETPVSNPFQDVKLTGGKAKSPPSLTNGAVPVSNDSPVPASSPTGSRTGKEKDEVVPVAGDLGPATPEEKKQAAQQRFRELLDKLPEVVGDWWRAHQSTEGEKSTLAAARDLYEKEMLRYCEGFKVYRNAQKRADEANQKATGTNVTPQIEAEKNSAAEALKKLQDKLEKEFRQDAGAELFQRVVDDEKRLRNREEYENEKGANVDQTTKDTVIQAANEASGSGATSDASQSKSASAGSSGGATAAQPQR